jgi:hypothetical protein
MAVERAVARGLAGQPGSSGAHMPLAPQAGERGGLWVDDVSAVPIGQGSCLRPRLACGSLQGLPRLLLVGLPLGPPASGELPGLLVGLAIAAPPEGLPSSGLPVGPEPTPLVLVGTSGGPLVGGALLRPLEEEPPLRLVLAPVLEALPLGPLVG